MPIVRSLSAALLLLCASAQAQQLPPPPVAPKVVHATTLHGRHLTDDYFWLREKSAPEVMRYLRAEADYAEAAMKPLQPLRDQLYAEMLGRIQEDDTSAPFPDHGYLYYRRTAKGKQYGMMLPTLKSSAPAFAA